jgi:hypothetical protein
MSKIRFALAFSLLAASPAVSQQLPFTLPANTVIGRTNIGPGEATAIPFAELAAALGQFQAGMTVGGTTISGGPGILFNASSGGTLQATTLVVNAILSTNGAGAPSLSSTLPNGISLGAALATSINGLSINSTTGALTIANGKTLTDTSGVTLNAMLLANSSGGFSQYSGSSCTNQAVTALSGTGSVTCGNITNAFLTAGTFASITGVGTLTAGAMGAGVTLGGVTMGLGSDATGDVYYNNGGVLTRLPKGSNGQVLELAAGIPSWASVAGTGTVTSVTCFGTAITTSGTCTTTGQIPGTATNDAAAAGIVGEESDTNVAATSVSLTGGTPANVVSKSLSAGDWEISGNCSFGGASTTQLQFLQCGLTTTTGVVPSAPIASSVAYASLAPFATVSVMTQMAPTQRFSLSATTTVFLVANTAFSVSTLTGGGLIHARRAR